jgi:two-component system cell cycle response regulator
VVMCVRLDEIQGLSPEAVTIRQTIRDRIFRFIAEMLTKAIRREDCVARSGEDEFLVAAMGITPSGATKFAARLAEAVAQAKIMHAGVELRLTASFGIAAASQTRASNVEGLKRIAERRAGVAQQLGGNRVIGMIEEGEATGSFAVDELDLPPMTISEALNLIARGQGREVLPYLATLEEQIRPLNDLITQQKKKKKPA